jgi:hypothetical protein
MMVSSMMHTFSPNTLNTQSRCMRSYTAHAQQGGTRAGKADVSSFKTVHTIPSPPAAATHVNQIKDQRTGPPSRARGLIQTVQCARTPIALHMAAARCALVPPPHPPHLVSVKVVSHHSQSSCAQQVALHELQAGLHIAAQAHAHQGKVLTHGEEVTALQEPRLYDVASDGQACRCEDVGCDGGG